MKKLRQRLKKADKAKRRRNKRIRDRTEERRECGDCQACCEIMGVDVLEKEPRTPCPHQCATGCEIYSLRPDPCRQFTCMWRSGNLLDEDMRPDISGVMMYIPQHPTLRDTVVLHEYREGALEENKGLAAWHVARGLIVYVIDYSGKRRIQAPVDRQDEVQLLVDEYEEEQAKVRRITL